MDNLSELSGPTSVVVETDIGPQGRRSSLILLSRGDPNVPGNLQTLVPPLQHDMAIDTDPNSLTYLFLFYYELVTINPQLGIQQLAWVPKLRLIPSSVSKNVDTTFVNGIASANLQLPIPPGFQGDIQSSLFVQHSIANKISVTTQLQNPLSTFFAVTGLAVVNGVASIDFLFSAIEYNSGFWVPLQGEKTIHLVITVV